MKLLSFTLTLRRMQALPRLLLLVARLGGQVTYISAADRQVTLALLAPEAAAHRFAPQLNRLMDITELTQHIAVHQAALRETA